MERRAGYAVKPAPETQPAHLLHEGQVEQQFEWGRDGARLVWVAFPHLSEMMVEGFSAKRRHAHA
jgi:hypothetical protein